MRLDVVPGAEQADHEAFGRRFPVLLGSVAALAEVEIYLLEAHAAAKAQMVICSPVFVFFFVVFFVPAAEATVAIIARAFRQKEARGSGGEQRLVVNMIDRT